MKNLISSQLSVLQLTVISHYDTVLLMSLLALLHLKSFFPPQLPQQILIQKKKQLTSLEHFHYGPVTLSCKYMNMYCHYFFLVDHKVCS